DHRAVRTVLHRWSGERAGAGAAGGGVWHAGRVLLRDVLRAVAPRARGRAKKQPPARNTCHRALNGRPLLRIHARWATESSKRAGKEHKDQPVTAEGDGINLVTSRFD